MSPKFKKAIKATIVPLCYVAVAVALFFGGYYFYNYKIFLDSAVLTGHELPDGTFEKITDKDYKIATYILDKLNIRYTLAKDGTEILASESDAKAVSTMFHVCSYE